MEQTDSDQRGGWGIIIEGRGRDRSKNMHEWPMDMNNNVGIDCGSVGWTGKKRTKGGKWDNSNRITIKN